MMETSNGQINIVDQLAMQRSAFRKVDYSTVNANGGKGGLSFTRIESALPESSMTYRNNLGEVWGTVNSVLQREIKLRESTTGDEQLDHAKRSDKLAAMSTVLGMDLEIQQALSMQAGIKEIMNQDLPTTRKKLESLMADREKRYRSSQDPEQLRYLEASKDLITFIDRLSNPSAKSNQPT